MGSEREDRWIHLLPSIWDTTGSLVRWRLLRSSLHWSIAMVYTQLALGFVPVWVRLIVRNNLCFHECVQRQ